MLVNILLALGDFVGNSVSFVVPDYLDIGWVKRPKSSGICLG